MCVALLAISKSLCVCVWVWHAGVLFYCIAPTRRHELCAKLIVEHDVDVNNCNKSGTPVLVEACETANENEVLCMLMLSKGADSNIKDLVSFNAIS